MVKYSTAGGERARDVEAKTVVELSESSLECRFKGGRNGGPARGSRQKLGWTRDLTGCRPPLRWAITALPALVMPWGALEMS